MALAPVKPTPIIKCGYEKYDHGIDGIHTRCYLNALISFKTGLPLFYQLIVVRTSGDEKLYFETFEEAMLYVTLHDLSIDTTSWRKDGVIKLYFSGDEGDTLTLSDGRTITLKSQPID